MESTELIQHLRDYGADINGIDSRFMGDSSLFERCFGALLAEPNIVKLDNSVKSGNYTEMFEAAHALKGLSGNLGLTPLYNAVSALVASIRAKEYEKIPSEYGEITLQLDILRGFAE